MPTYKTPGVFVEEVSTFPPSVAAVETAVPAFIGYVSKAEKRGDQLFVPASGGNPAVIKPTEVKSLPEFEAYFGKGPNREITVELDINDEIVSVASDAQYQLYDSIRMFFLNGGRKSYIVPVGFYGTSGVPVQAEILAGLEALRKVDEPTLIVVPDAVSLSGIGQYEVYVQALRQCAELQDRFAICDLANVNGQSHDQVVTAFRNNVGINNLLYGAAYTPWLKSTLPRDLFRRDIEFERQGTGTTIFLSNLTTEYEIRLLINDLNAAITEVDFINGTVIGTTPLQEVFVGHVDTINAAIDAFDPTSPSATSDDIAINEVRDAYNQVRDILSNLIDLRDNRLPTIITPPAQPDLSLNETYDFTLSTDIDNIFTTNDIASTFETLLHHSNGAPLTGPTVDVFTAGGTVLDTVTAGLGLTPPATGITDPTITALYPAAPVVADAPVIATIARQALEDALPNILKAVQDVKTAAETYEKKFDEALPLVFSFYKNALDKITDRLSAIPPSGAIAGIYATVDANRGVFKAPANVSVAGVSGLTFQIDNQTQEGLNIEPNAGKSINAIRAFTGKGILVWGARTLAGNDNEWKYIPVRRFFNFAEESIKKATSVFVFEPNDANTCVKVRAMIENFLDTQWRAGALAGAKSDNAFFVKVGLGETMTPDDILNGNMIVEVGMAVVRPAEFIILRFSHKMQES